MLLLQTMSSATQSNNTRRGQKGRKMLGKNFAVDELIEGIKVCLADAARHLAEEGRMSNREWTKACLGKLSSLGEDRYGYQAAPCSRCGEHGWLYDLIWWEGEDGSMTDLILALESEWSWSAREVRYDFQKLVQARARIKVLISDALSFEECGVLISDINNFKQNENDGVYLFAMYNGDSDKPGQFAFYTKETLCKKH